MKKLLSKLLLVSLILFCLYSCNGNERLVTKFMKRMNAHEVNAASKYIYPGDHVGLYFFDEEIYSKSPNTLFKIKEKQSMQIDRQQCVIVQLECLNVSPFFQNYMSNLGLLQDGNIIVDTIYIRETDDGKHLSFDWAKLNGENLKLATISDTTVVQMDIRSGPGKKYPVVGKLNKSTKTVINEYSDNPEWVQSYTVDEQCNIVEGFIRKDNLKSEDSSFFKLSIFNSLGILVCILILVVIAFPLIYMGSIFSLFSSLGIPGILLCVGLILGLLYAFYQLLENVLFELFLINLPY